MQEKGSATATADLTPEERCTAIQLRLRASGNAYLRQIECEYCNGAVILRGRVPTYYAKQLAQALLLADPIVHTVENHIEVVVSDFPKEPARRGTCD